MSRTLKVFGALVAGITLVSGVLLALEPGPSFRTSNVAFSAFDDNTGLSGPEAMLFDTAPSAKWKTIVIRDSRGVEGGQEELNKYCKKNQTNAGADYHFVVCKDGTHLIQPTERWKLQNTGGFPVFTTKAFNESAIEICLIGDCDKKNCDQKQMDELVWLVTKLQKRHNIPAENVYVQTGKKRDGGKFSISAFKSALVK